MVVVGDYDGPDLFVCKEFDAGVRKDAKECGGVAAIQAPKALVCLDVSDRGCDTKPGASVLCKLRIARLEQDLDAVKRSNDGLGLLEARVSILVKSTSTSTERERKVGDEGRRVARQ